MTRMITSSSSTMLPFLFLLTALPHSAHAFLGNAAQQQQQHKDLAEFSTSLLGSEQVLKLRLDLGLTNNDPYTRTALPRLALQGPTLQLANTMPNSGVDGKNDAPLFLPGAHMGGASTGAKNLQVLEAASFIGMNGVQKVPLEKGCWEMVWVEGSFSGRLICAFDMPYPIHRNGVTFEAGPLHMTFNLYSEESLASAQAFKTLTQQKSVHLLNEKEEELFKMQRAGNLLAKAVHYQRAFAAFDKLLVLPTVSHIPDDHEVVRLKNGLFLVKEGKIWKKTDVMLGPSSRTLGKVVVSVDHEEKDEREEDFDIRRNKRLLRP